MSAILHQLDQRRLIDSNGIAAGASVYFYVTGTTTKAAIYTTDELTTQLANPIVVGAGAQLPDIYLDSDITYRRRIVYADGTVDDTDPYAVSPEGALHAISRTAMANLGTYRPAILTESGREGTFVFDSSDLSAKVTADTQQGIYVAPSSDTTGASGAWVRNINGIEVTDYMFGAVDGSDNTTAIQAWAAFIWDYDVGSAGMLSSGTTATGITLGPGTGSVPATRKIRLAGTIKATAAMDSVLTIKSGYYVTFDVNSLELWGANTTSETLAIASRLAKNGLTIKDCANATFVGTYRALNMYYWGLVTDVLGSSSFVQFPNVRAKSCGSSPRSGTVTALSANWSAPVLNGSAGSSTQTTTLTVDAVPAYDDPQGLPRFVKISGFYYLINSIVGNTLTLALPWLDKTSVAAATGTLQYVFGGAAGTIGTTNGACRFGAVNGQHCGILFWDGFSIGSFVDFLGAGSADTEIYYGYGRGTGNAFIGGGFKQGYCEGSPVVISISYSTSSNGKKGPYLGPISTGNGSSYDFQYFFQLGPRNSAADDTLRFPQMYGSPTVFGHESRQIYGNNQGGLYGASFTATWDPASIAAGGSATTTVTIPRSTEYTFDQPLIVTFSNALSGLQLTASVSAINTVTSTVTAVLSNSTAGAVDLASGTLTIKTLK